MIVNHTTKHYNVSAPIDVSMGAVCFYSSFALLCFTNVVGGLNFNETFSPLWEGFRDVLGAVAVSMLLLKYILQPYSIHSALCSLILVALGVVVAAVAGDSTLFFLFTMACAIDDVRLTVLARILFATCVLSLLLSLILTGTSLLIDKSILDSRAPMGIRYALGFVHPNVAGKILVSTGVAYCLGFKRRTKHGILVILLLIGMGYFFVNSRTTVFALVGCLITLMVDDGAYSLGNRWVKLVGPIAVLLPILCTCLMVNYSSDAPLMRTLNVVLSYRPEFWHAYYSAYGISPFGARLLQRFVLNKYGADAQLDGAYVTSLIQYGLIGSSMLIVTIIATLRQARKGHIAPHYLILCIFLLLVGLTENYVVSPFFNPMLLCIGCIVRPISFDSFLPSRATYGSEHIDSGVVI